VVSLTFTDVSGGVVVDDIFIGVLIGVLIGWVAALLVLLFFDEEIFSAIDLLRKKVRSIFGLDD